MIYDTPEVGHSGRFPHRLASNPRERVFAESWAKQQRQCHTLQWLLCVSPDQKSQERDITQAEATCAATLMQWLGSPVGRCWLEDTLKRADESALMGVTKGEEQR